MIFLVFVVDMGFSQANTGVITGYTSIKAKPANDASSGFYAGLYADFPLLKGLDVQPELFYARASSTDFLYLPLLVKVYWPGTDINFQVGPQATYILRDLGGSERNLGFDLAVGLSYDLLYNVFVDARYAFKLDAHDENYPPADFSTLTIGLGFSL